MKNRTGFESFSAVIHRLWKNENLITRTKIMTGCSQKIVYVIWLSIMLRIGDV